MNKITINLEDIKLESTDGIEVVIGEASKFLNVQSVKIKIFKDTDIFIVSNNVDIKLDFYINVLEGVRSNIYEIKHEGDYKFQYKYYLEKYSYLNIEKINDGNNIKEMTIINLNGENARVDFNLKTVSKNEEKYNFLVYHNALNTSSNILNNGVNIMDGVLEFNVSGFVSNRIKGCNINQKARIINLIENTCVVKPNLFIDEVDTVANHSAHIGTFKDEELFYLMSRGLDKENALKLLIKGFLLKGITNKDDLENIVNKYWG